MIQLISTFAAGLLTGVVLFMVVLCLLAANENEDGDSF